MTQQILVSREQVTHCNSMEMNQEKGKHFPFLLLPTQTVVCFQGVANFGKTGLCKVQNHKLKISYEAFLEDFKV